MSPRSFAAGFLAGIITPAFILLIILAVRSSGSAVPTPVPTVAATATRPAPAPTAPATSTPAPTPTSIPVPAHTPAPTSTPSPVSSPTPGLYQVEAIDVPPRQTAYVVFSVPDRYVLEGYFEVTGGNDDITFWATGRGEDPVIKKKDVVGRAEFKLSAKQSASYTLYFDNGKSVLTSKQVTIHYRLRAD